MGAAEWPCGEEAGALPSLDPAALHARTTEHEVADRGDRYDGDAETDDIKARPDDARCRRPAQASYLNSVVKPFVPEPSNFQALS